MNQRGEFIILAVLFSMAISWMIGVKMQQDREFKEKGCVEHIPTADGTITIRQGETISEEGF